MVKKFTLLFWLLPWLAFAQVNGAPGPVGPPGYGPVGGYSGPVGGYGPVVLQSRYYVLDHLLGVPAAYFSTQQATNGPNLPAYDMVVRRSSDNQQTNIGFYGGWENVAQLASFCAGTNAYLVTWKNQGPGGSAYDVTQATAANQPQVCANGLVESWNARPTVYFAGSEYLATSGNVQIVNASTGVWSAGAVANSTTAGSDTEIAQDSGTRQWGIRSYAGANLAQAYVYNSAATGFSTPTASSSSNLSLGTFDGSNLRSYGNGTLGGTIAFTGTVILSSNTLSVGARPGGSGNYFVGDISVAWAGGFVQATSDKLTNDVVTASFFNIAGVTQ